MRMPNTFKKSIIVALFLTLLLSLTACSDREIQATSTPRLTATPIPPTRTPFPPSPTPIPVAAEVNGEIIPMAVYQSELARYKAAVDRELTPEDKDLVINNLIQLAILAQAARSQGYQVSSADLQSRMEALDTEDQPLDDWLSQYGYTQSRFKESLARSIAAAWMRDSIISQVPQEMEQIHAQQILLYEKEQAEAVLAELDSGTEFAQLASSYDPQTQGDLGWFPRGYLTMPALDEIIFDLESGEISDMIETDIGYHIVKVLEREEDRPLDPEVRQVLQRKELQEWLERQWNLSTITISIP